ncbi:hypothetical protein, partial [Massilicoli timonensis]|uniref:hypothetical protein n=1 Tax=Massilicoli timonensis TaxID=2015901 RepID=UPI003AAACE93
MAFPEKLTVPSATPQDRVTVKLLPGYTVTAEMGMIPTKVKIESKAIPIFIFLYLIRFSLL